MDIFNNKFIFFLVILLIIVGLFFFFKEKFINSDEIYSNVDINSNNNITYNFRIIPNGNTFPSKDIDNKFTITNNGVTLIDDSERGKVFNFNGSSSMSINATTPITCTRTFWLKTSTPNAGHGNVFSSTKWPVWFNVGEFLHSSPNFNNIPAQKDMVKRGTGWVFYAVVTTANSHRMYVNGNTTPVFEKSITNVDDNSIINFGQYISNANHYKGLLDDMRSYNVALSPVEISQIYYTTIKPAYKIDNLNLIEMDEILLKNKPWALYTVDSISSDKTKIFDMYGNNDRTATITGTLTVEKISGFGSSVAIPTAIGTQTTQIMWPSGSLPQNFTICSVTRYAGARRQRILQATKNNWLHGHHWEKRGPVHYNNWIIGDNNYGNQDDWIATCSTKTADNKVIMYQDNVKRADSVNLPTVDNTGVLTINNSGVATDQVSDFGFTYLIIWDKALTDSELLTVSKYLNNYIKYGIHCNSIINCGLSHHYSFDSINNNTILNNVTNSYDATTNGAIVNTSDYKVGSGSLYLNGSTFVTLPNINITNKGFTIASWFKLETMDGYARLFDFGLGAGNNNIIYSPGSSHMAIYGNSSSEVLFSLTNVFDKYDDNKWHHYAWTMSYAAENSATSICKVYIDGKLIYVNNTTKYPKIVERTMNYIGKSNWSSDKISKGYIDDFRIYNRELSEVDIMVLKTNTITHFGKITNTELTNMNNLLSSKIPWGIYVGESINNNTKTIFDLYGNNNRYAKITGNINVINSSGNGAAANILQANGTTNTVIEWPDGSLPPNTFTICSITRYNGNSKQRILNVKNGPNFLHGHHNKTRGVVYNDEEKAWRGRNTRVTENDIINDWVVVCSTNSTTERATVIVDDIDVTENKGGPGGKSDNTSALTINAGNYSDHQKSDFGFSTLIVWNRQLTTDELKTVSRYLHYYLLTGTHCSSIQNLINNLQNTSDYKTVIIINRLKERLTNTQLTNAELTNMNNLLSSKPAWGIYVGESINNNTKTIFDLNGNPNRYARITGDISVINASGNGATANILQANGTTNTVIEWPVGSINTNFTICSITRYTGTEANKAIIQSRGTIYLNGHWNNQRGVIFNGDWRTREQNNGTLTDWVVTCHTNSTSQPITSIIDNIDATLNKGNNGQPNANLVINDGYWPNNKSNFGFSTLIIWNEHLTSNELVTVSRYLRYYLSTGTHCSTIQNLINNLQNTTDYKTIIASSLAAARPPAVSSLPPAVSSNPPTVSSNPLASSLYNLVKNGNFSSPILSDNAFQYTTQLSDWNLNVNMGHGFGIANGSGSPWNNSILPVGITQFLYAQLLKANSSMSISQSVLINSGTYTLSFYYSSRANYSGSYKLKVLFNSFIILENIIPDPTLWKGTTKTFSVSTTGTYNLEFVFEYINQFDQDVAYCITGINLRQYNMTSGSVPYTSGSVPYTSGSVPYTSGSVPYTSGSVPYTSGSTPYASVSTPYASVSTPYASSLAPFSYQRTDLNNYNFRVQIDETTIPLKDMTNNFTIKNIGPVTIVNDNLRGNVFNFNGSNYLSINAQTPITCTRTFWLKTSNPSGEGGSVFCSSSWSISFNKSIYLKSSPNDTLSSDDVDRGNNWVFYAFVVTPTTHRMYVNGNLTPVFDKMITNKEDTSTIQFGASRGENFFIGLLDDMRSYNYELSAYQINQLYNDTIKPQYSSVPPASSVTYTPLTLPLSNLDSVNFDSLISLKNPWAIYVGEGISLNYNKIFDLYGYNNRYGSIIGETLGLSKATGFGANGAIVHLSGNENTKIDFSINSIPENYTICSITRYSGTRNNRILAGKNKNIALGHWNGKRGISLNNGVGTDTNGIQNPSDWLVMCSSNSTEKIKYIADSIDKTDSTVQENKGSDILTINNIVGPNALETSQFGFSYLIIWDQHLSSNQLIQVSRYLRYYLETGTHSPKIVELINNLRNTNDVKSILSPKGETSMYSSLPPLKFFGKAGRPVSSPLKKKVTNAQVTAGNKKKSNSSKKTSKK